MFVFWLLLLPLLLLLLLLVVVVVVGVRNSASMQSSRVYVRVRFEQLSMRNFGGALGQQIIE